MSLPTTPRLPIPGGDDDQWGDVLNQYLSVEHNADGSLKDTVRAADLTAGLASVSIVETTTKTTAFAATSGKLVPVNTTGGAVTVTLPVATNGAVVAVRFEAGTNVLTVAAAGSDVIGSGSATSVTDMVVGETRTWHAVPGQARWQVSNGFKPVALQKISASPDFDGTGAAVGQVVTVKQVTSGQPTQFGLTAVVPVLLIANAAALPAGTPAGTIVVVKS